MKDNEILDNELLIERLESGELEHHISFDKNRIELRGLYAWVAYINIAIFAMSLLMKAFSFIYLTYIL
jgi:hypothetical protein